MNDKFPQLEMECDVCKGSGRMENNYETRFLKCNSCNGIGIIPTDFGEALLGFLKERLTLSTKIK